MATHFEPIANFWHQWHHPVGNSPVSMQDIHIPQDPIKLRSPYQDERLKKTKCSPTEF